MVTSYEVTSMSYVYTFPYGRGDGKYPTIRNFGMAPREALIRQCFPATTVDSLPKPFTTSISPGTGGFLAYLLPPYAVGTV